MDDHDDDDLTDPTDALDFGCDPEEVIRRIETFTLSFLQSLADGGIADIQVVDTPIPTKSVFHYSLLEPHHLSVFDVGFSGEFRRD